MRNKELPPECYPATVRIPGSFLIRDDRDLIEIVGRMCGDDVRDVLRERLQGCLYTTDLQGLRNLIEQIASAVSCMEDDLNNIDSAIDSVCENFFISAQKGDTYAQNVYARCG